MASLVDKPVLNKEFSEWTEGVAGAAKGMFEKSKDAVSDKTTFLWVALVVLIALTIGLLIWYFKALRKFETPANISRLGLESLTKQGDKYSNPQGRVGIRTYLQNLKTSGVPDTHLCFTNFYYSTVNASSCFLPAVDAVVTPTALKVAYDGGARAFVFDLWPDMTPGANFAPVLQIVEAGSNWRRISMNALPLASCLQILIQTAYQVGSNPGSEDPLILYLRFRGVPRKSTYTATAQALQATIEPYRLDTTFYNCRGQDDLFKTPILNLFKKVIVASNVRAEGNMLSDYINVGPKDGIKLEWRPNEANGLSIDAKSNAITKVQQNLSFVAPATESPEAANNYDNTPSFSVGVHCCAMNFWNHNDALKKYLDIFGSRSFAIKPVPLRYVIEALPASKYPENPNWGSGTTAGTPVTPPAIRLP